MKRLCNCGHGPLYHFQKAGACHARLEEGATCPCQAFRPPADAPQAPKAVDHDDVGFRHSPPSKVARAFWLVMLALGFLAIWLLSGCSGRSTEEYLADSAKCDGKRGRRAYVDGAPGWTSSYDYGGLVDFYPEAMSGGKYAYSVRVWCSSVTVAQRGVE